ESLKVVPSKQERVRGNRAPLKITIHKGSQEIGGNCIQLSSGKTTILLDAGLPLSADSRPVDLSRLIVAALLVSHLHQDHFGLMATLPPGTLFYSGHLRAHGRKAKLLDNLIQRPVRDIDLLFLEGTMLHRNNDLFPDETAVENTIFQTIRQQKNISFLLSSSQNIDRIVSAYRACKRAGKLLVIDIYTAWVLEQLRQITENTPAMDWPEIRVFVAYSQDQRLKANPDYFGDFRKRLYRYRVKREELHATPEA